MGAVVGGLQERLGRIVERSLRNLPLALDRQLGHVLAGAGRMRVECRAHRTDQPAELLALGGALARTGIVGLDHAHRLALQLLADQVHQLAVIRTPGPVGRGEHRAPAIVDQPLRHLFGGQPGQAGQARTQLRIGRQQIAAAHRRRLDAALCDNRLDQRAAEHLAVGEGPPRQRRLDDRIQPDIDPPRLRPLQSLVAVDVEGEPLPQRGNVDAGAFGQRPEQALHHRGLLRRRGVAHLTLQHPVELVVDLAQRALGPGIGLAARRQLSLVGVDIGEDLLARRHRGLRIDLRAGRRQPDLGADRFVRLGHVGDVARQRDRQVSPRRLCLLPGRRVAGQLQGRLRGVHLRRLEQRLRLRHRKVDHGVAHLLLQQILELPGRGRP